MSAEVTEITVRKAPDDPVCTRVSCGGNSKIGFYLTYRGTVDASIEAMERTLLVLKVMKAKGIEAPLDDKMRGIGESGRS